MTEQETLNTVLLFIPGDDIFSIDYVQSSVNFIDIYTALYEKFTDKAIAEGNDPAELDFTDYLNSHSYLLREELTANEADAIISLANYQNKHHRTVYHLSDFGPVDFSSIDMDGSFNE